MDFKALDKALDAICTDYDYGIVPGSVTVFVRDRIENVGRFEMTLLEGILLIIDAVKDGFKVTSCTPFIDTPIITASLQLVQDYLEVTFDTMDRLLMTISPLFAQRLLDKIHTNLSPTLTNLPQTSDPDLLCLLPALHSYDPPSPQQQQQQTTSSNAYGDVFEWIH